MVSKAKHWFFNIIDEEQGTHKWAEKIDNIITVLIFLSVLAIILESIEGYTIFYKNFLYHFEVFVVTVFTIEYLLRWWLADLKYPKLSPFKARVKYVCSGLAIIDLLSILPFYLPLFIVLDLRFIRMLRLFRLLRIFKLTRYSNSLKLVSRIIQEKKAELTITFFITFILLIFSSTLMYHIERDAQPEAFPNIISTFWWAIATLTTVGYGDIYPITPVGKLVSGVIALLGIGLVALPTGILSSAFVERINKEKEEKLKKTQVDRYKYCPHCGKSFSEH